MPAQGVTPMHAKTHRGALLVEGDPRELFLGIFLSEAVAKEISSFRRWHNQPWSRDQIGAFTIATEEISHFHYLVHHAARARQVSQLELELQGEIDKFLLTFFANYRKDERLFEALFEQLFYHFSLATHLSAEEKARYQAANDLAKRFIRKHARALIDQRASLEGVFRLLRRFYRLDIPEKVSLIAA